MRQGKKGKKAFARKKSIISIPFPLDASLEK
jgi:hypothetical protein